MCASKNDKDHFHKKKIFKTTDTSCRIGGPLSENFQGDLILLNNAAVHRAYKSRSIGPVHLLVESCDGVIGRLFYCSGWRRVD